MYIYISYIDTYLLDLRSTYVLSHTARGLRGCYFACSALYADRYGCSVALPGAALSGRLRAIFLAAVLVGDCVAGSSNMYPPPQKASGERYEPLNGRGSSL